LEVRSTTGATADWPFAAPGAAEFVVGAAGAGAEAETRLVAVPVVTVRTGAVAGLAATCAVRVVVRLCVDVVFATVVAGGGSVALVSLAAGAVSVVAGGVTSTVGGGLVVVVVAG
jgi:hypothetical protein